MPQRLASSCPMWAGATAAAAAAAAAGWSLLRNHSSLLPKVHAQSTSQQSQVSSITVHRMLPVVVSDILLTRLVCLVCLVPTTPTQANAKVQQQLSQLAEGSRAADTCQATLQQVRAADTSVSAQPCSC
jgi:mRNA-degrading endonuclease toxin of MazEF toxin-antitoxin module